MKRDLVIIGGGPAGMSAAVAAYESGNLDSINWNDPIIIYDEYGFIVYDPSVDDVEDEEIVEQEDPNDLQPEGSDGDLEEE